MLIRALLIAALTLVPAIALAEPPGSFPEGSYHMVCKKQEALQTVAEGAIQGGTDGIADAFGSVPCVVGQMRASFVTIDARRLGEADLLGQAMVLWSAEIESTLSGAHIWLLWFEPAAGQQHEAGGLEI